MRRREDVGKEGQESSSEKSKEKVEYGESLLLLRVGIQGSAKATQQQSASNPCSALLFLLCSRSSLS